MAGAHLIDPHLLILLLHQLTDARAGLGELEREHVRLRLRLVQVGRQLERGASPLVRVLRLLYQLMVHRPLQQQREAGHLLVMIARLLVLLLLHGALHLRLLPAARAQLFEERAEPPPYRVEQLAALEAVN